MLQVPSLNLAKFCWNSVSRGPRTPKSKTDGPQVAPKALPGPATVDPGGAVNIHRKLKRSWDRAPPGPLSWCGSPGSRYLQLLEHLHSCLDHAVISHIFAVAVITPATSTLLRHVSGSEPQLVHAPKLTGRSRTAKSSLVSPRGRGGANRQDWSNRGPPSFPKSLPIGLPLGHCLRAPQGAERREEGWARIGQRRAKGGARGEGWRGGGGASRT